MTILVFRFGKKPVRTDRARGGFKRYNHRRRDRHAGDSGQELPRRGSVGN